MNIFVCEAVFPSDPFGELVTSRIIVSGVTVSNTLVRHYSQHVS